MEVMFCEDAEHRLRICLDHLSFIFNRGDREQQGDDGDDSHDVFVKEISGEKLSARQCVVMQQPVILSSMF
jgi:hypothetical protein